MDRLNRLSDTEARLFEIIARAGGEYLYDYEIIATYKDLYQYSTKFFRKDATHEKLLRNMRSSGVISGGRFSGHGGSQKTRYRSLTEVAA